MPELTAKLGIKKPLGNETVSRASHNENFDIIDQMAVREPFLLKSYSYDSTNDQITLTIGPGRGSFLGSVIELAADSIFNISTPIPNTTYYVFLKSDGIFTFNTSGDFIANAVLLHSVVTGATVDVLTAADHRGEISGDAQSLTPGNIGAEPAFSKNTAFNKNFAGSGSATTVARSDHNHDGTYEPVISKNTAFNKNFGTTTGTVADGGSVQSHKTDKNNPHQVTAAQVGAETPSGAQTKADAARDAAENWVKSYGLGGDTKDIRSTDLNDLFETGLYRGQTLTNAPNNSSNWYFIINLQHVDVYRTQLAFEFGTNKMFIRYYNNIAWTSWAEQETTSGAQSKADAAQTNAENWAKGYGLGDYAKLLAVGTDLNTLQTTGFYRVNAGVNIPPRIPNDNPGIWHYILVEGHDTVWTVQTVWEYNTGTMFTRTLNNGVWGSWKQLAFYSDVIHKSGDTMTGDLLVPHIHVTANGEGDNIQIGDDAKIGDVNSANHISIQGVQDPTQGGIVFGNGGLLSYDGTEFSLDKPLSASVDDLQVSKSGKDSNGIFTTVQYNRKAGGALAIKSVLSGGTSPQYTTRTITYYAADGTTVQKTNTFTLSYDSDGDLVSEV